MDPNNTESDFTTINSQPVPSPDLFSSDDEDNFKTGEPLENSPLAGPSEFQKSPEKEDIVIKLESSRLQRLMDLLQGVPPPPSVTIPQITLNEVLHKLKENTDKLNDECSKGPVNSLWKPTASLQEVLRTEWPEIKNIVFHDMHFNRCSASEDVERVSMKLHERFIGAETSSWCNAVTSLPNSAKKRQKMRNMGNTSPGCRLSHLARRRQTFSSANLAQLSSVAGSGTAGGAVSGKLGLPRRNPMNGRGAGNERRRIMVEIKKSDKNKRIKTNSKEALSRIAQSGNIPNKAAEVELPTQFTKRALFLSPEEQKRVAPPPCPPAASEANEVQRSKRALWPSDQEPSSNEYGKRSLDKVDSSTSQKSKVHCPEDRILYSRTTRSLPFMLGHNSCGNTATSNSSSHSTTAQGGYNFSKPSRRASDQGPSSLTNKATGNLSELHKRKLFWAVTSALRNEGITKNHGDFTRLASILAFHYMDVRHKMKDFQPASTSEHMLEVVSAKASEIVQLERAERSVVPGQEENQGGGLVQRKEERPNKELFRDATASLNVRRSLCVSLSSSNHQETDSKPKQTKRVPSARKSLSFDSIDPKSSSGTASEEPAEKVDGKYQLDSKGIDPKWRVNGENVPLASAKRVSRSLFLSPKDDVKAAKKDACEQTCGPDDQLCVQRNEDEVVDIVDSKSEGLPAMDVKKANGTDVCDFYDKLQQTSELSSIPSVSAVSSTLEADNEASRTSEATCPSEPANSVDASTSLPCLSTHLPFKENGLVGKDIVSTSSENLKPDSLSSESNEFVSSRVLRETKERVSRATLPLTLRRSNRKSLSLNKRDVRSSSTDSVDQEHVHTLCQSPGKAISAPKVDGNTVGHSTFGVSQKFELKIILSPAKVASSPMLSTDSHATSKSVFGSPPFVGESSYTPVHSPFLGFPPKEEHVSPGVALHDGASDVIKIPAIGEGSSWSDTPRPEVSSEEGNMSQSENDKVDLEEKVITPLLEAAILESSVCVGSGSCNSTDADLSFRGRIESLKPLNVSETAINLDLGMNLNVSANLLNMDENNKKSPVLEKWAERASRSAQKNCSSSEETNGPVIPKESTVSHKVSDNSAEESMLPWEESQLDAASQCSTIMFEKFRSIFDSSSHQGNS